MIRRWLLVLAVLGAGAGCDPLDPDERADRITESEGDLAIGLVWGDGFAGRFLEGAMLAVDEINGRGGVLFKERNGERRRRFRVVTADATPGDDPRLTGLEVARGLGRGRGIGRGGRSCFGRHRGAGIHHL
ncbi:MAG: hypothetical protein HC888_11460 [Candidatus Competibacteraceae bacterium]|nr:hypothetical protein [Candidatus Competibacteraceae bacterium]